MEHFAKVFESHGRQVLARKGQNSDGDMALVISTMVCGTEVSIFVSVKTEEMLDALFIQYDQECADHFARKIPDGSDGLMRLIHWLA